MKSRNSGICMVAAAVLLIAIFVADSAGAAVDLMEGEWETVTETVMEGIPFTIPPTTITQCIDQKDLVPGPEAPSDCTFSDQKISGDTVRWKAVCKDQEGKSKADGEITYAGKTYKGTMRMVQTDRRGKKASVSMKLSGRYLGPCTGKGPTVNGMQVDAFGKSELKAAEARGRQAKVPGQPEAGLFQEEQDNSLGEAARKAVKNPVKAVRGVFGF